MATPAEKLAQALEKLYELQEKWTELQLKKTLNFAAPPVPIPVHWV